MEDVENKLCSNCKREIPAVNFTIHSVHCARNIKICPVCKEPVPSAELEEHHELLHKLLPCKQCGESVCGTDLEDHIRDSCANTVKTCRFCELELPRRELPPHEAYCGVRTEQCGDCGEYVMIKYRQLHLDSNHGFIRLDDDPAPIKRDPKQLKYVAKNTSSASTSNGRSIFDEGPRNFAPKTQINYFNNIDGASSPGPSSSSQQPSSSRVQSNGTKKRTNDQPQINTDTTHTKDLNKDLAVSRGAVKKRPAPPPPPKDPKRDLPYHSAVQRRQREDRERRDQNLYNAAHGLPPVLNPAAKLEKLRKMDAMQNPELAEEYKRANRRKQVTRMEEGARRRMRAELQNAKPMSPEEFSARFSQLQVAPALPDLAPAPAPLAPAPAPAPADRFQDIKTSLTELRRGLNEVTAPYNVNNNNNNNNNERQRERHEMDPRPPRGVEHLEQLVHLEERLPCEFCEMMLLPQDLVQHQTGCRPDLAQYVPPRAPRSPRSPRSPPSPRSPSPCDPVIPCEFCARSLPVYLIAEHQEQCAREVDLIGD